MLWQGSAKVIHNIESAPGYCWMRLHAPEVATAARPGQFVHIRCGSGYAPLLRRPMSIGRVDRAAGTIDILYKIVGAGTKLLAQLRHGDAADLLGPLGTAFSFPPGVRRAAVLGRGIGTAPLLCWATEAARRGLEVHAFLSARTSALIFGAAELSELGVRVYTGADDGSGLGSDDLLTQFTEVCRSAKVEFALTCGSRRMARLVSDLDAAGSLYGEVSLEAQMGCAMGACRGCVCQVREEKPPSDLAPVTAPGEDPWRYALVCQEGPVFPVRQVIGHE